MVCLVESVGAQQLQTIGGGFSRGGKDQELGG
jgi:hypothetical protein